MRMYRHLFNNRPKDAFPPAWHKLWNLYWRIKKEKPVTVVEFGSGCSTVIMAQALYENKKGHLYTYEESEKWWKATLDSIPKYLKNVTVIHSPVAETEHEGIPGYKFTGDIKAADFVYLDGPVLNPKRKVAVDVLHLRREPKYIVVDSRKANCDILRKHLGRYAYSYNPLNNQSLFSRESF